MFGQNLLPLPLLQNENSMKTLGNVALIDNYFGLIDSLTRENKIKLMAKLSASIAKDNEDKKDMADMFFGAYKSKESPEEIISKIRESRNFNRKIEAFE